MAFEFTPGTYKGPLTPETGDHPDEELWRYYNHRDKGYHVLITSGVALASPGTAMPTTDEINAADAGSGEGNLAWFRGGITYTVTSAEKTILEAAGYTVETV